MTKKHTVLTDTFEQLTEFGADTAKKTGQALKDTFNPLNILGEIIPQSPQSPLPSEASAKEGESPKFPQKHTPLNFEKLGAKFKDQEKLKTQALRQRLFQLVKGGEEKVFLEQKRKKQEKQQKLLYEEQEKKRKEEEKKRLQQQVAPKGKTRKSIFSHKKVAEREHLEVKPASGKQ